MKPKLTAFLLVTLILTGRCEDWPMWRHDPGRSASTTETLPETLHLQWARDFPPPKPAYRNRRLQFDRGYEPVIQGATLYVGSSLNDSITAIHTENGETKWQFFTDGPVRFAPVIWKDRVYAGSDDGHLYCLNAADGSLNWKYQAVPSDRKLLGNGRLISVWPVRGGPVLSEGRIFFAAGVWSFEGVFVYALDAESGDVIWLNDRSGYVFGLHPHGAQAFGGLSPQGYLVVNGDDLVVPCGAAVPATFDIRTGELKHFELPGPGRVPGAWFASVLKKMSTNGPSQGIVFDSSLSEDEHEDQVRRGGGLADVGSSIQLGSATVSLTNRFPSLDGAITGLAAANGRVFVATAEGTLACFGGEPGPGRRVPRTTSPSPPADGWSEQAVSILEVSGKPQGYAIVLGLGTGRLIEELARRSNLHLIGIDRDAEKVVSLRARFDRAGLYGTRIALLAGDPLKVEWPPYLASLIVSEDSSGISQENIGALFRTLRPYGGVACLPDAAATLVETWRHDTEQAQSRLRREDGFVLLTREGALPGAVNYTGDWTSPDPLVKAPLGVLWFDDTLGHFKRSPQPMIVDGIMVSQPKNWAKGLPRPYSLLPTVYSDVYTGRVLSSEEAGRIEHYMPSWDATKPQPNQYRPPGFSGDPYKPPAPEIGTRISPLTGLEEKRDLVKSYGCDGGVDYGHLYTMRSGTAAFYDKRVESGTVNISGPRSGCSNSIIPANGVLNVPYFFEGCTCSYPLPVGLVMVNMPPEYEQWTAWGPGATNGIQRLGINLGAPGDRMTEEGTLWIDFPSVGGPSPAIDIHVTPTNAAPFYRHSTWIDGQGWPWVNGSGLEGLTSLSVGGLKSGPYTVRLHFAETRALPEGSRRFGISLQGKRVVDGLDIRAETGAQRRGLVREFKRIDVGDTLTVEFSSETGLPLLCGLELIADHLDAGDIPRIDRRPRTLLSRH